MSDYELTAGVETHVQLATASKLFCGCSTAFGATPNSQVCPVCLGLPGALPVLNAGALDLALKAALALNCTIPETTKFDRKSYFYPDLPKGYQISQYDQPVSVEGWVEYEVGGAVKRAGIARAHMEEDAGKLVHEEGGARSFVDLNRAGVPLVEIVTTPDFRSAAEVQAYLDTLKAILRAVGISACDMEKGELRCDVNVSLKPRGAAGLGVKTEVKNLNSFRNAGRAIEAEFRRQAAILDGGGRVEQVTLLYDAERDAVEPMRSKEDAHDYRYFPEPDLLPLKIAREKVEAIRRTLPELPLARRRRLEREFGLSTYDAEILTAEGARADFFERAAKLASPKSAANWIINSPGVDLSRLKPEAFASLLKMIDAGVVTSLTAKEVLAKMAETGQAPEAIVSAQGLGQVSDTAAIEKIVRDAMAANPKAVEDFRAGKESAQKWFVGQVMRATKGRGNPAVANEIVTRVLKGG